MLKKIKEFFRNLFKINNKQYIEAPKEETHLTNDMQVNNEKVQPINNIQENQVPNLRSRIIVENKEERAIQLQKDFKAGLIKEQDLSEEDFNLLTNLYEEQIEKTKQSIQEYKNKIVSIKEKLALNSNM